MLCVRIKVARVGTEKVDCMHILKPGFYPQSHWESLKQEINASEFNIRSSWQDMSRYIGKN